MPEDRRRSVSFWKLQEPKPNTVLYLECPADCCNEPPPLDGFGDPLASELHPAGSPRYVVFRCLLYFRHAFTRSFERRELAPQR